MAAQPVRPPGWVPRSAAELSHEWTVVEWDHGLHTPEWMAAIFVGLALTVGLADVLAPLAPVFCVIAAVILALNDQWLWALFALVCAPFLWALVRAVYLTDISFRLEGVRVRTALRTVKIPWSTVWFGTTSTRSWGNPDRMHLVVSGGKRVVVFEGMGEFIQKQETMPALAAQLNAIADQMRAPHA